MPHEDAHTVVLQFPLGRLHPVPGKFQEWIPACAYVDLFFFLRFAPSDAAQHPSIHPTRVVVAFQRLSGMPRTNLGSQCPRNALAFSLAFSGVTLLVPEKVLRFPSASLVINLTDHAHIEIHQFFQKLMKES
jgi:hypothetical protein